jgi:alkanesulfonate monooxygenase
MDVRGGGTAAAEPEAGDLIDAPLRFHWSLSSAGEKHRGAEARTAVSAMPNLEILGRFCRHAEDCGMESLLTAFGFHRPDPIVLAAALGSVTRRIKFMIAVRSGVMSPTLFVQQINSVAAVTGGRVCLNVVAGHTPAEQRAYGDFLAHDDRYDRTDEFLSICAALWRRDGEVDFEGKHYRIERGRLNLPFVADDRSSPEIYLGGSSEQAERLAMKHAHCMWRLPDRPEVLEPLARRLADSSTELGLLVSLLVRPTREQAIADAYAMIDMLGERPRQTHQEFAKRSDSVAFRSTYELARQADWLTPYLWTGAVPYMGAPAIALVGSPEDVAKGLLELKSSGVTQFLFMGWPDIDEMTTFSRDVLPLVRAMEVAHTEATA